MPIGKFVGTYSNFSCVLLAKGGTAAAVAERTRGRRAGPWETEAERLRLAPLPDRCRQRTNLQSDIRLNRVDPFVRARGCWQLGQVAVGRKENSRNGLLMSRTLSNSRLSTSETQFSGLAKAFHGRRKCPYGTGHLWR